MPRPWIVLVCLWCTAIVAADALAASPASAGSQSYDQRYRPQFHFTPRVGWMNDPNGLVFFDGEFHLFFQHRPDTLEQTAVESWGHAVSPDLVHWTELPLALRPDDHDGYIWSGSAVVDWNNTSGFGVGNQPALVAMYTAAKDPFAQAIAFSTDRGRTWTKYAGNPVIPHIASHNRDPHLFWYGPTRRWVVVLFKDVDDTFCLLDSPDLKHWTHLQDFRVSGCEECPDLFPLPLDGKASDVRWVFTAANGKYLVGDFDGHRFVPQQDVREVDYGRNFYAVQTWSDIPPTDGRRIQIAWMAGGKYPGMPFNQQMSFPAQLTLRSTADGPRLFRNPVREIELLHTVAHRWADRPLKSGEDPLVGLGGDLLDIRLDLDMGDATAVSLTVHGQPIRYDAHTCTLTALGSAPLQLADGRLRLTVLVDRTSIETFAGGGRVSLTSCYLPPENSPGLSLRASGGAARIRSLVVWELKSAWQ